jgi:L-cysteine---[L-cysteinyl-carrier protein] ligase PchF
MTVPELLAELERDGVQVWEESGALRFRAPHGVMTPARRASLAEHRQQIIKHLADLRKPRPPLTSAPADRNEPFALTQVQAAYLLGRRDLFPYGDVSCHGYGELTFPRLDPSRLESAWQQLVQRHDMLRAVIDPSGTQRVLPEVPDYRIKVADLRGNPPAVVDAHLDEVRGELSHRIYRPAEWPLFELRVTLSDGGDVLHFSIDFLIADFASTQLLLLELQRLHHDPDLALPPLGVTFRDYCLAERESRASAGYERDREYWSRLVDDLPPAPALPLLDRASADPGPVRFRRWRLDLGVAEWAALREASGRHDVTASVAILAAYAETLGRWCGRRFTLDLTLADRRPLHPHVESLVGDFTSVELLAVELAPGRSLAEHAREIQGRLWADLDHRDYSGLEVMREVARRRGPGGSLFPVVYTGAVGADSGHAAGESGLGQLGYGITQTPQVWIDCQVIENRAALTVNWDVREGIFPDGLVDDMFNAFDDLLRDMASGDEAWNSDDPVPLPAAQRARRHAANATQAPLPDGLLQDEVLAQARRTPDRLAVISPACVLTYGELAERSAAVAQAVRAAGCGAGDVVGVLLEKGADQPVAVLGVLRAGAAYLPIDVEQPPARRDRILADANVRCVVTHSGVALAEWPPGVTRVMFDGIESASAAAPHSPDNPASPDDLAYVIYTSGSSGMPKGVMITHRSALNTVADISRRFGIGAQDRVLGLASLGFDLSVYDIFGPLAIGAAVVLPAHDRRSDPSHWASLIASAKVTVWNSVPAQMQMFYDYLKAERAAPQACSLRVALLSGDWIPVTLPGQIRGLLPGLDVISLGGATEAAIWSIWYPIGEVPEDWLHIPYGLPLANQSFHVLDEHMRPCPDWVTGELYIGGAGLALGYIGNDAETRQRFIVAPARGERLYRTGDLGRYLRDGTIEFLGRADRQVKIRGHRIELAEVEEAIRGHPGIGAAVVLADGDKPLERRLAAFAEPARRPSPELPGQFSRELCGAVGEAAAQVTADIDLDRYARYAKALQRAALTSIREALSELGPLDEGGVEALCAAAAPRYSRLIRRLARVMEGRGHGQREQPAAQEWERVATLAEAVESPDVVRYFRDSARSLAAHLRGEADPLQLLFPEGRLDVVRALYAESLEARCANAALSGVVRKLASLPRQLRVLEVGAGTGATTSCVLPALAGRLETYVVTDISLYFASDARDRFAGEPRVSVAGYDLNRDYRAQGLYPNSFDLVVAGDTLHAVRDTGVALASLAELLVSGGWLVFSEVTRDSYPVMASLELLQDGVDDERAAAGQAFLTSEQWQSKLAGLGAAPVLSMRVLGEQETMSGMCVFAARVKADRIPVSPAALRASLARRLPDYMIPAELEVVDALPLTSNGKLDHKTMRAWLGARDVPAPGPGAAPAGGDSGSPGDLRARLAAIWTDVLGDDGASLRYGQGFLRAGGDSLLAARLAGRLRDELPEAVGVPFDELLRVIMRDVTVTEFADTLPELAGKSAWQQDVSSPVRRLAVGGTGPVRVLVHDETGTLDRYAPLLRGLAAAGPLAGLVVPDPGALLHQPHGGLIDFLADRYAEALMDAEILSLSLIGGGAGGMVAVEVARRLTEAGAGVHDVFLLTGSPLPGLSPSGAAEPPGAPGDDGLSDRLPGEVAEYSPLAYAGDITLIRGSEDPASRERAAAFWKQACLGDLRVIEPGDDLASLLTVLTEPRRA